jgi:hypothetical protein
MRLCEEAPPFSMLTTEVIGKNIRCCGVVDKGWLVQNFDLSDVTDATWERKLRGT